MNGLSNLIVLAGVESVGPRCDNDDVGVAVAQACMAPTAVTRTRSRI
jgi:hypothetical protein